MTHRRLVVAAALLGGCTPGTLGNSGPPSSDTSPGSVVFQLALAADRAYCDVPCRNPSHIGVFTLDGRTIGDGQPSYCGITCSSSCVEAPCPAIPVIRCDPVAVPLTGATSSWDGLFFEAGTCGNHQACTTPRYVLPGRYLARMCATSGTVAPDANGVAACTATGPEECVDVPFDLPGPTPVIGTLPAGDGGV